ncbi:MAG: type I-MYXAN CRISPR-associated protein Cas6/Cmx6, partial [Gammaproteobacteria bacterium SHHR-1]
NPDEVVDLSFRIQCRQLPVDHIHALSQALTSALPWLLEEPRAAIHPIHAAGSQNGWNRPRHSPDELLQLSKRTRLRLRLPQHRLQAAEALSGQTLEVAGHPLTLGQTQIKPLAKLDCLFARHLVCAQDLSEADFLQGVADELKAMDIGIRKALSGKSVHIHTPQGGLHTRSLLLASLPLEESLRLQQRGLGQHRLLGCGIFIPHKGIEAVGKSTDDGTE